MAPPASRPPSLPCIPDIALDMDEKTPFLPELDEILSSTGESATLDEDDDFRPSRSHSTHTQHSAAHRRIHFPTRLPSSSSNITYTYNPLPLTPRRPDHVAYQVQPLQLPPHQKTLHESWTITYHHPTHRTTSQFQILGLTLWRQTDREEGSVLSVVPNTHFTQGELAAAVAVHEAAVVAHHHNSHGQGKKNKEQTKRGRRTLCKAPSFYRSCSSSGSSSSPGGVGGSGGDVMYATDLERRLRSLDWKVQDEIYELLSDRVQSSSNAFRRREWRVVVLTEVPGGELTDAPTGLGEAAPAAVGKRRRLFGIGIGMRSRIGRASSVPEMPITEYRLILRGTETKTNDQGWGYFNRYSRPWRTADEKEIGERRRWSTATGRSDKYVDF
ncbi:hypothetical protein C8A03DRAFT_35063 [Achaetomium macrosporum]|uniref:Uncharacterized protein n=1 Tax=Achaetomium macrosporum TaxID=79813 RepID=A0AAN7C7U0_9PEZI|nr:hypothetical protein C8A03DRAFT_35063 [Achaetomium macrosporum]